MGCDTYSVMIDNIVVAKGMSIEHAVIFVKAVYNEYYNEKNMKVSLIKEPRTWEEEDNERSTEEE
jgi:hypothetical protein